MHRLTLICAVSAAMALMTACGGDGEPMPEDPRMHYPDGKPPGYCRVTAEELDAAVTAYARALQAKDQAAASQALARYWALRKCYVLLQPTVPQPSK